MLLTIQLVPLKLYDTCISYNMRFIRHQKMMCQRLCLFLAALPIRVDATFYLFPLFFVDRLLLLVDFCLAGGLLATCWSKLTAGLGGLAVVLITQLHVTYNVFSTLLESFAELIWDKRCSNLVATFAKIYFESLCR